MVDDRIKSAILAFVDKYVPEGGEAVWLTGSRVRGDAKPDSDWDVAVVSKYAPSGVRDIFRFGQTSTFLLDGGPIEMFVIHPNRWNDPQRYMVELRASGVRLR